PVNGRAIAFGHGGATWLPSPACGKGWRARQREPGEGVLIEQAPLSRPRFARAPSPRFAGRGDIAATVCAIWDSPAVNGERGNALRQTAIHLKSATASSTVRRAKRSRRFPAHADRTQALPTKWASAAASSDVR